MHAAINCKLSNRLARRYPERHARTHYTGKNSNPESLYEVEFLYGLLLFLFRHLFFFGHARPAANSDTDKTNNNAGQHSPARCKSDKIAELPVEYRRSTRTESRTETKCDCISERHSQIPHRQTERQSPDA